MDEIEDLPIVREEPLPPIRVTDQQLKPVLTEKEYKQLKNSWAYATPEMGRNEIEPTVVYWDWNEYEHVYQGDDLEIRREKRKRKQIKFLLLPKAISGAAWLKATVAARESYPNKGSRAADGQRYGRKLTLGWMPQLPGYAEGSGYYNVRSAPTLEQPELLAALYPLVRDMDRLMERAVPDYYNYAFNCAMTATRPDVRDPETNRLIDEDDLTRIKDERHRQIVEALDPWNLTYTIRGTVFSTIEFNRNIIFKAHEDGHNVEGTCVCITTLDSYAGGRLVFPRYGYSAELGPQDLLICDNNKELHANLGPIVGNRYSVVAFLHESVCGRAPVYDGRGPAYESGDGLPTPKEEGRD
jgi:hypothetical protein